MSGPESGPESATLTTELVPDERPQQLGVGNSQLVGTAELLKCTVATTIRDLRLGTFADGETKEKKHKAVVIVFEFEFLQDRRSWKPGRRLESVKIDLGVYYGDDAADGDWGKLKIAGRYPISAEGAGTPKQITHTAGVSLEPTILLGTSVGNGTVGRESAYTLTQKEKVASFQPGDESMHWKLGEEGVNEHGVPDRFAGAVLIRTDGVPYSLKIEFTAYALKRWYKGKAAIEIDSPLLWVRQAREHGEADWHDFDSAEFKEWVKGKTENTWAVTANYGCS